MDIYLDNIASTPILEEIKKDMPYWLDLYFANPSSSHNKGFEVKEAIIKARKNICNYLGIKSTQELIFTSGDIESNNLAIKGYAIYKGLEKGGHILASQIEHISVLHPLKTLEKIGFEVEYIPVDSYGFVDIDILSKKIRKDTILVSIGLANREIGTIENIKELAALIKEKNQNTVFHSDISACVGLMKINMEDLGVDMASFAGHYFYAPHYSGGLYIKKGVHIRPIIEGGTQEGSRRPGIENIIGILGMEKALKILYDNLDNNTVKLSHLRELLKSSISTEFSDKIVFTGHPEKRLPNHLSFYMKSLKSESIISLLNMKKIYVSSNSPCISSAHKESYVLKAIGTENPEGALILSIGLYTEEDMIGYVAQAFSEVIKSLETYTKSLR